MKFCQNCGMENQDDSRVCVKCGVLLPAAETPATEVPAAEEQPAAAPAAPKVPVYQAPPVYQKNATADEEPISVGKWFLYHLIPMIPMVGSLVYIIMLFVWAFGGAERNTTFRNWAKAQLIYQAVMLVVLILLIVLVVAMVTAGLFAAEDAFTSSGMVEYYGY